ncbi:hypothetical protein V6N13_059886 [Hibiscus sabdariffa]
MEDFEEDMIFIDGEAPTGVFGDDVGNASAFAPVFNSPVIVTSNFEAIPMVHNLSTPSSLNKELLEEAIKVMEMVKSLGSEFNAPDVELEKGVGDSC